MDGGGGKVLSARSRAAMKWALERVYPGLLDLAGAGLLSRGIRQDNRQSSAFRSDGGLPQTTAAMSKRLCVVTRPPTCSREPPARPPCPPTASRPAHTPGWLARPRALAPAPWRAPTTPGQSLRGFFSVVFIAAVKTATLRRTTCSSPPGICRHTPMGLEDEHRHDTRANWAGESKGSRTST